MNVRSYKEAKEKFLSGDFSVAGFFLNQNCILEYAYCKLLTGDYLSAENQFFKIRDLDLRADWGYKLVQLIKENVSEFPTYFQIRNFLEIDLNLLLKARQPQLVENVINCADIFFSINPESYKFISRVMTNNNFNEVALFYLLKAKEKFYYDPELHFMLANCYVVMNDYIKAKDSILNCLNILPEYFPAKKLLEKINAN